MTSALAIEILLATLAASSDAKPPPLTARMVADELCAAQREVAKPHDVTPRFVTVRKALEAREWARNRFGLAVLRELAAEDRVFDGEGETWGFDHPARSTSTGHVGLQPRCREAKVLVRASIPALGRLLERTPRPNRPEVLITISHLKLGADAAPLEPVLVRCLGDENLRLLAAQLLRALGPALHPDARAALAKVRDPSAVPPQQDPDRPLSKSAAVYGMELVRPKVEACYVQYRIPGLVMANVVIAPNGAVTGVTVTGKFSGTETGACVEAAVRTAPFPRSSEGLAIPYPFQLK